MSKKNPTKRRKGSGDGLSEGTLECIRFAAKALADAKKAYDDAWPDSFKRLAKSIGYASPQDAIEIIMEEVESCTRSYSESDLETAMKLQARQQQIDWKKEELELEIRALEQKRKQLD